MQRQPNLIWKIQVLSFQESPILAKLVKDFIIRKPLQNCKFCTFFPKCKLSQHKVAHKFSNSSNFFRAAFFWRLFYYENIDQFGSSWCHLKAKNLNFPNQFLLASANILNALKNRPKETVPYFSERRKYKNMG